MVWLIGFGVYGIILLLLIFALIQNQKTKNDGDHLEQYISEMTDKVTKKAGALVFSVTIISLIFPVLISGIGLLIQRYIILPPVWDIYIFNGRWYSLVVPALFAFTLPCEFFLRCKWKRYAVSALYARNVAPPNYQSRRRFLVLETILFTLSFPFFIFSLGNFTCFTDTEIRYSKYFSPTEYRYEYSDVIKTTSDPVVDTYGNPDILYTITFSDGNGITYKLSADPSDVPKMQELIQNKVSNSSK